MVSNKNVPRKARKPLPSARGPQPAATSSYPSPGLSLPLETGDSLAGFLPKNPGMNEEYAAAPPQELSPAEEEVLTACYRRWNKHMAQMGSIPHTEHFVLHMNQITLILGTVFHPAYQMPESVAAFEFALGQYPEYKQASTTLHLDPELFKSSTAYYHGPKQVAAFSGTEEATPSSKPKSEQDPKTQTVMTMVKGGDGQATQERPADASAAQSYRAEQMGASQSSHQTASHTMPKADDGVFPAAEFPPLTPKPKSRGSNAFKAIIPQSGSAVHPYVLDTPQTSATANFPNLENDETRELTPSRAPRSSTRRRKRVIYDSLSDSEATEQTWTLPTEQTIPTEKTLPTEKTALGEKTPPGETAALGEKTPPGNKMKTHIHIKGGKISVEKKGVYGDAFEEGADVNIPKLHLPQSSKRAQATKHTDKPDQRTGLANPFQSKPGSQVDGIVQPIVSGSADAAASMSASFDGSIDKHEDQEAYRTGLQKLHKSVQITKVPESVEDAAKPGRPHDVAFHDDRANFVPDPREKPLAMLIMSLWNKVEPKINMAWSDGQYRQGYAGADWLFEYFSDGSARLREALLELIYADRFILLNHPEFLTYLAQNSFLSRDLLLHFTKPHGRMGIDYRHEDGSAATPPAQWGSIGGAKLPADHPADVHPHDYVELRWALLNNDWWLTWIAHEDFLMTAFWLQLATSDPGGLGCLICERVRPVEVEDYSFDESFESRARASVAEDGLKELLRSRAPPAEAAGDAAWLADERPIGGRGWKGSRVAPY